MKNIAKITAIMVALGVSSTALLAQDEPAPRGPRGPRPERRADGERPGQRGPGPEERGELMAQRMPIIAALDANKDGVIDSSEIDNAVAALKTLDANKDGQLTREELRPKPPGRPGPRGEGFGQRGGDLGPGPRPGRPQPPRE